MNESIGPYRVEGEIGRGGMGVVYRAVDSRLDRVVAIKSLPEEFASDPVRLERFEREARVLAQVTHANIAGIYGLEEQDGARYLVLEYVEGETLAEVLERGPMPVDDAIDLAAQIAEGVAAAHDAGVIHRDLKPGNVIITPDVQAKVLDFGLARADGVADASTGEMTQTPTATYGNSPTIPGAILGTAPYMSPEQARGKMVDKRTDIWSFGVMLYEMLTGIGPFRGETATESIGAILHKDVDFGALPEEVPANVQRVLERCLERDKAGRFRDIGDVRLELLRSELPIRAAGEAPAGRRVGLGVLVLAGLVLAAGAAGAAWFMKPAREADRVVRTRTSIQLTDGLEVRGTIAISPDGETVAFQAVDEFGTDHMYTRRLDSYEIVRVEGSRGGGNPFFSPDSRSLGFFARRTIWRVSVEGGEPNRLVDCNNLIGASWGADGTIVYSEGLNSPLRRVGEDGRPMKDVSALVEGDGFYAHVWPQFVPGTGGMLFTAWPDGSTADDGGGRWLDLATGEHRRFGFSPDAFCPPARWVASGHVIFEGFGNVLSVYPFDPSRTEPISYPASTPLLAGVQNFGSSTRSAFDVSSDGTLVYVPSSKGRPSLVWVDERGGVEEVLDESAVEEYTTLRGALALSPDGTRALLGGGITIVEIDLERRLPRRVTKNSTSNNLSPAYSPGGSRVYFASNRETRWALWSIGRGVGTEAELALNQNGNIGPFTIADDGTVAVQVTDGNKDILLVDPDGTERWLTRTPEDESVPAITPDGRWVAFAMEVNGVEEIFVVAASGDRPPVQVSRDGGHIPKWSGDGSLLYYRRGRSVMRVGFDAGRTVGEAERVFAAPRLLGGAAYDISPDGTRMLAVQVPEDALWDEIRVETGFFDEIRRVLGESED